MINPPDLASDKLYFADTHYMSVSIFKLFEQCQLRGLKGYSEPSTSMLVGSFVDSYVSGSLDEFIQEHPEIISTRGETKGKLKSEFKKAEEICKKIDSDRILQMFLSGEKQQVFTGNINGVPWKIKVDSYSKGKAIVDLKIMQTITNNQGEYIDFISKYGYDVQLACYQHIIEQNTNEKLPCFIAVATKEDVINTAIIEIPQIVLDRALYRVESRVADFYKVMQGEIEPVGCGKCNVCVEARTETPIISMSDIVEGGIL